MEKAGHSGLLKFTLSAFLVVLTFWLLIVGQALLLPLVIALVFCFLINLLASSFSRLRFGNWQLPGALSYTFSIFFFLGLIWAIVELIAMNIDGVLEVAPQYQENLEARMASLIVYFGVEQAPSLAQLTQMINIRVVLTKLAASLTSLATNSGVILIYLAFLLLEQSTLDQKLSALLRNKERELRTKRLLAKINEDVRKYISIKLLTSSLTGLLSYFFLKVVGVDFAEFWGVLIFLLNFIPTVGSIVATVFPCVVSLVQFETLGPFVAVATGIIGIQIIIGNVLEPRMMGSSLNLSPMIILINLSLWGMIWGIAGMFLCVPILVITMIVLSHIPQTRAIAVILSRDGQVSLLPESDGETAA